MKVLRILFAALWMTGFAAVGRAQSGYDAIVAQDGSGQYTRVQQAIDAAPEGRTAPYRILVREGSYREKVHVPASKPFIHLIGTDAARTVIHHCLNVGGKPNTQTKDSTYWQYSVHNPASEVVGKQNAVVLVEGADFYAENITFRNDWGIDFFDGPQALAMNTQGDRAAFYRCNFRSFQDTWMTTRHDSCRLYVRDCWIEGAVDYFYGSGETYVENCTFYSVRAGSVILAPGHGDKSRYGYVMDRCTVAGTESAADVKLWGVKLGRPWRNAPRAVWLHTTLAIDINAEGWCNMGTIPAIFAEYDTRDAKGKPVDLSGRKTEYEHGNPVKRGTCPATVTKQEAVQMTYRNIVMGSDGWNPRQYMGLK